MILGYGIDVADLGRVKILLTNMEEDFLLSTFTAEERETACLPEERVPFFAGRLAAKEAVVKALGTQGKRTTNSRTDKELWKMTRNTIIKDAEKRILTTRCHSRFSPGLQGVSV